MLFFTLDLLYGKKRTLSKFKVLELVARVPYQAWEQVAYIAITYVYGQTNFARRIHHRVREAREQQDNEQSHLLILSDLIDRSVNRRTGSTTSGSRRRSPWSTTRSRGYSS